MPTDDRTRNSETESGSAGFPVTAGFDAIKGTKHFLTQRGVNAGTALPYRDFDTIRGFYASGWVWFFRRDPRPVRTDPVSERRRIADCGIRAYGGRDETLPGGWHNRRNVAAVFLDRRRETLRRHAQSDLCFDIADLYGHRRNRKCADRRGACACPFCGPAFWGRSPRREPPGVQIRRPVSGLQTGGAALGQIFRVTLLDSVPAVGKRWPALCFRGSG